MLVYFMYAPKTKSLSLSFFSLHFQNQNKVSFSQLTKILKSESVRNNLFIENEVIANVHI